MFQGKAVPGYLLATTGGALILFGSAAGIVLGLLLLGAGGYLLVQAYKKGW